LFDEPYEAPPNRHASRKSIHVITDEVFELTHFDFQLATLIRSEYFTPLHRLPITLATHFYRRNFFDAASTSTQPRKSIKKGALRRSLKRKASSRLLTCEVRTAALAQSTTRSGGRKSSPNPTSALAALQLISKEKKLRMM